MDPWVGDEQGESVPMRSISVPSLMRALAKEESIDGVRVFAAYLRLSSRRSFSYAICASCVKETAARDYKPSWYIVVR